MNWNFEIEYYKKIPYEYKEFDGLFVETLESCIVSCFTEWSFIDAFAVLYFRRKEVDFDKLSNLGRWKRASQTNLRVWTLIKYGCKLLNEHFGKEIFKFKAFEIKQAHMKELVEEAIEKVIEFAKIIELIKEERKIE
ncbi:MAG: hypothetical protein RQ952_04430 [Thermoproteota archaeon]|jgi:hypothetical protein|nr:hypothetical protein [Thermoproteota archaeon]